MKTWAVAANTFREAIRDKVLYNLVFFALLAYQARRGVRKARTLLLVVGLFAALFEYTVGRVTILGLVSALLIIVAAGFLYSPPARRFYLEADR